MISLIILCVGVCFIVHFVNQKNKIIRDKVTNSWLSVTATITNFEERIEIDGEGDRTTIYIAHGEYYVDNIPYHFEERINKNDMYNISYMNVFFNPIEPTEYITEKGLNSAVVQTKKSYKNYIHQNKINTPQNNDLNNKTSNIFLMVFLIPFILIPVFMIHLFAGSIIQKNFEYEYVSQNWILTSANITNITEQTYYDDEGSTTTYIAKGEYTEVQY